jgi:hypothetical protein
MRRLINAAGLFLISIVTGGLYAAVIGLFFSPFRAPMLAWPILTALFWFVFWKFKALRFVGFMWAFPVGLIGFELYWATSHPGMVAEQYMAPDRSHYIPARVRAAGTIHNEPDMFGAGLTEAYFGADGFRADPETGKGNPARCQFVLIGDSMVYGSGLPYRYTFGPVLEEMGIRACIFGVTGNSPVDYLATARHVADRIDAGAQVAFYLYAYNDFVHLNQFISRGVLSLSNRFTRLFAWAWAFDDWRRGTLTFARFAASPSTRDARRCPDCAPSKHGKLWQYDVGKGVPIKVYYPHDPAQYEQPEALNSRQRAALHLFLDGVKDLARGRAWRVMVVIHPDDAEFYANLARRASVFVDLDPRRAEALKICKEYGFSCADISHHIYRRAVEEGKNPYFMNNRHFSIAGTRIVAESFVAQTKEVSHPESAATLRRRTRRSP